MTGNDTREAFMTYAECLKTIEDRLLEPFLITVAATLLRRLGFSQESVLEFMAQHVTCRGVEAYREVEETLRSWTDGSR